jgi:hypothetical protein
MTTKTEAVEPADDWSPTGDGWEVAETNIGEKVVWPETPTLLAIYRGWDEVPNDQGELVRVYLFTDDHGKARFAWNTPELKFGLRKAAEGDQVAIHWDGKEEMADGKRTINRFRVAIKRQPAAELTGN